MLSIYFNTENSIDFSGEQQIIKEKQKEVKPLFNFKSPKEDLYDFTHKFYTVDFDSIKGKSYIIDYTKEDININKKIGDTKQVKNDCWLLAGIYALANTSIGQDYINKAIRYNRNKDIVIHFKGTNVTITIPQIAFNAAKQNKSYVQGDDNMLAIELATEYYKKMLIINKQSTINTAYIINGKHTFGNLNDPLAGGYSSDIMYLITGKEAKTYFNSTNGCTNQIKNLTDKIKENPDKYAATCNFQERKNGLYIHHAYTIKKIDENFVTLLNPHNSAKEEKLPIKDFYENVNSITFLEF